MRLEDKKTAQPPGHSYAIRMMFKTGTSSAGRMTAAPHANFLLIQTFEGARQA
jgi:hypothetical protein